MRILLSIIALLMFVQVTVTAQDDAPEAPPVKKLDTNSLLHSALAGNKDARVSLGKLDAEELQRAIQNLTFESPKETGVKRFKTDCPDGYERPYWVRIPKNYDPSKAYPLIVGLHGGVSGQPLYAKGEGVSPGQWSIKFWEDNLGDNLDKVFLLGCSAGPRETHKSAVWWEKAGRRNILHFLFETKRQFNIDDDKVFLTGHSDGGSGSFAMAAHTPSAFAGYFPMNGNPLVQTSGGQGFWLENFKGKNIYTFNSGKDALYPAKSILPIYEQANKLGASINFLNLKDNNHGIMDVIGDEIPKFMKQYLANWSRNLTPDSVDWTCDKVKSGWCDWVQVTGITESEYDSAGANQDIVLGPARVRLGVMIERDVDQPTVQSVVPKSTAEKMGIKAGDEIIKMDGKKIESMDDLIEALSECKAGDDCKITVKRGEEEKELEGEFAAAVDNIFKVNQNAARVIAELTDDGLVLKLRNTSKLRIHLTPKMIDNGELKFMYMEAKGSAVQKSATGLKANTGYILHNFLKTADRKSPFVTFVNIDLSKLKKAPKKDSDEEEEDF